MSILWSQFKMQFSIKSYYICEITELKPFKLVLNATSITAGKGKNTKCYIERCGLAIIVKENCSLL